MDGSTPARANGHRQHCFCGESFCVSKNQHELLSRELGAKRGTFDLLGAYPRWDALNEPIDNLLPWLKARIAAELQRDQPHASKLTLALQKAGQW